MSVVAEDDTVTPLFDQVATISEQVLEAVEWVILPCP